MEIQLVVVIGLVMLVAGFFINKLIFGVDTSELEKEKAELEAELSNEKNLTSKLVDEKEKLVSDNTTLISDVSGCKNQNNSLSQRIDDAKLLNDKLDESNSNLEKQVTSLKKVVDIHEDNLGLIEAKLRADNKLFSDSYDTAKKVLDEKSVSFDHNDVFDFVTNQGIRIEDRKEVLTIWYPLGGATAGKNLSASMINEYFGN